MQRSDFIDSLYFRVGKNIAFFRKQRGLKQEALGADMKISQTLISQYETAKKRPNLETIQKFCIYFNIPLQKFLFTDFSRDNIGYFNDYSSNEELAPIEKCTNCTYYCYYIKEQNKGTYDVSSKISYFTVSVLEANTKNSASAMLFFPEKSHTYNAILKVDDRYAYIESHEFSRDFFFHLTFYYHKSRSNPRYSGGISLMQRFDANELPVSQYCVISINQISEKKQPELIKFLQIIGKSNIQLPRRRFSSSAVVRLTKTLDKETYDWLRKNNYIQK